MRRKKVNDAVLLWDCVMEQQISTLSAVVVMPCFGAAWRSRKKQNTKTVLCSLAMGSIPLLIAHHPLLRHIDNLQPMLPCITHRLPCSTNIFCQCTNAVSGIINHVLVAFLHAIGCVFLRYIKDFVSFGKQGMV